MHCLIATDIKELGALKIAFQMNENKSLQSIGEKMKKLERNFVISI